MSTILTILGVTAVLALLALLATGIVAFHRGQLAFETVVHTYTAFVLATGILFALSGGALVVKSLASIVIARDFSYQTAEYPLGVPPPGMSAPPMPTAMERALTQAGDDLTAGITLIVVGLGLGAVHAFGNAVAARRDMRYGEIVERGFAVAMLAAGTVVSLASSVRLLNDLLRRYVITTASPAPYTRPLPGGALGFALMFVPLWIYFARRVWRSLAASRVPANRDTTDTGEKEPPRHLAQTKE